MAPAPEASWVDEDKDVLRIVELGRCFIIEIYDDQGHLHGEFSLRKSFAPGVVRFLSLGESK